MAEEQIQGGAALKLPAAFAGLDITVFNDIGRGPIRFCQKEAYLVGDRWILEIFLLPAHPSLKIHRPGSGPEDIEENIEDFPEREGA